LKKVGKGRGGQRAQAKVSGEDTSFRGIVAKPKFAIMKWIREQAQCRKREDEKIRSPRKTGSNHLFSGGGYGRGAERPFKQSFYKRKGGRRWSHPTAEDSEKHTYLSVSFPIVLYVRITEQWGIPKETLIKYTR